MKRIMAALVLMTLAQTAAAAKLERSDFLGRRLLVVDQKSQQFTGLMTIDENYVVQLDGQTGAISLNCEGAAMFDEESQQILSASSLRCKGGQFIRVKLSLSKSDEDVSYLLQNGLTPAVLEVTAKFASGPGEYTEVYSGAVDIKRLAK